MTYEEKYRQVAAWWGDFRFQLAMAVKSPSELNRFLAGSLSSETMYLLSKARKKGMPFFATPYYLSLLDVTGGGYDDAAIRSYILYSPQLVETYGQIRAWEREDVVEAGRPNAAGWLLPDGHNIHRRYPEVAILIPDTMGRACGGLCASCQRMYDFQSERLNFEFETLRPKESWDHKLRRLMNYFEEDTQLRDILITGGDALMSQNKTLRNILEAVCRMAGRKRRANARRPDGEKYAELQRVRLGSRLPAYLPMRVNDELVEILREFREKASAVGVKQFIIQTHFQTPLEVTPEAEEAIRTSWSTPWPLRAAGTPHACARCSIRSAWSATTPSRSRGFRRITPFSPPTAARCRSRSRRRFTGGSLRSRRPNSTICWPTGRIRLRKSAASCVVTTCRFWPRTAAC